MLKKIFTTLVLCASFMGSVFAQSSEDIELAKQLARQRGYSEAQIEAMMSGGGSSSGSSNQTQIAVSAVDRNEAVEEIQKEQNVNAITNVGVKKVSSSSNIYGHDIFKSTKLDFVPNYNMPTPENYKLSAGDEIVIDIWGDVITNITAKISPDGSINIPNLGPVYLLGETITSAESSLKKYLSKIYSGIIGDEPTTFAKLSLGKIRSVSVNVIGDVVTPGTYTLPSLSTMASALYLAGGPNGLGTVREIALYRNGKLISTFDVYDFITKGDLSKNIRLEDNDVITVKPYYAIVTLDGGVKRAMRYEVKEGESLDKILYYAGGFTANAYDESVVVTRKYAAGEKSGATVKTILVEDGDFSNFRLENGDIVNVKVHNEENANKVNINGAVWLPGSYALEVNGVSNSTSVTMLSELINRAGGLKDEAYLERAYIERLSKDRTKEQLAFSPMDVILNKSDIELMPNDVVRIVDRNSLYPNQTVEIRGELNNPGRFTYREGMSLGDVIIMANGTTDAATLTKVEIARRIKNDSDDLSKLDTVATILYYNLLRDANAVNDLLQPNDIIFVRKAASYKPQQTIQITGEVNYPGSYVVEKNVVRISDIVNKASGLNSDAYADGAKLTRVLTSVERERIETAKDIAKSQTKDSSLSIDLLAIESTYSVAIDLNAAIANPGSFADIVLREGDVIEIPKLNNTVKISGAVLYPNVISYKEGMSWKKYLSNAGGTTRNSIKRKAYMVHMNGSVAARGSSDFKVRPGTEIIIPAKDKKEYNAQTMTSIMSLASSTTSLAAMVMYILNLTK